ncbi:flagellar basal-body rod modification protein FlgD [Breoghania corrubedonensis]|uniref:Basal-body rod modification protein FlgD n=1 Tax=Breoghania corrubedonensis TaxID=665038 RepID=A0A2T5UU41_9HYPH|nr:flagellar hook capping FlgD N-terminal domain-containing protein [Breoghania corrubedonensis]PTW54998.1 flagellar basal-body rod modification protein FlgD [Breoghania corrubedonensis]
MVDSITGSSSAGSSAASNSTNALSSNYEMFLSLLTAQLKVQDPLDPLKAEDFTNQLVQYSSVEQQIKLNSSMDTLIDKVSSSNATNLVGYIGQRVTATGDQSVLIDGYATWEFDASKSAEDAEITIRNSMGAIVYSHTADISKGKGAYVWDGRTNSGTTAPDGAYSIEFSAKDANGKKIDIETEATGIVDGIDFSGSEPVLKMGDVAIPLSSVTSVSANL